MSDEKNPERLPVICTYCGKYKNKDGYWEHVSKSEMDWISHGICPECLKEHFPNYFSSLCREGRIVIKQMISPDNKVLYGCFLIVNNKGCLFGEYDKEQRV
jgi:hypothetical protein